MPVRGNPSSILTPGRGPNGPGCLDMRAPVASVGTGSAPYGPGAPQDYVYGFVRGFQGPAATSLRRPTSWYVRAAGANTNGGSSVGTAPDRTGTDGATTSGALTFTAASGAFTPADIGKGICIQNATFCYAKITAINSSTSVQLSNPPSATAGSLSWAIGGAWADARPFLGSNSFANTSTGVMAGDTVYIGPGTYRQIYTMGANFGAIWANTGTTVINATGYIANGYVDVVGDVTGVVTGDPAGAVILTGYTTNDKTAGSASPVLTLSPGKGSLRFRNLFLIEGGAGTTVSSGVAAGQNISFTNCAFQCWQIGSVTSVTLNLGSSISREPATMLNWLFDRCLWIGGAGLVATLTTGVADYDSAITLLNCQFQEAVGIRINVAATTTAQGTGKGGGVRAIGCVGGNSAGSAFLNVGSVNNSTVFPCYAYGCVFGSSSGNGLAANTTGQLIEDYNVFYASTPRSNVNIGAASISDGSYAFMLHHGQELIWGGNVRPKNEPMAGSPVLGLLNAASVSAFRRPTYDFAGRPRPAGGVALPFPAAGAFDRGNTWAKETVTFRTGPNALSITGPGYQDFSLAVDAAATTVGVYMRYDSSYVGTKPQIQVLNGGECGVADATSSAVVAVDTWELLTLAFTPTSKGIVTIRLLSSELSGAGKAFADDYSVS